MTHGILLIYMERWGVGALSLVSTKSLPWRCVKQHLPVSLNPTLLEFYLVSLAAITFVLLLQTCLLILRQYQLHSQNQRQIIFRNRLKGVWERPQASLSSSRLSSQRYKHVTCQQWIPHFLSFRFCSSVFNSFFQFFSNDSLTRLLGDSPLSRLLFVLPAFNHYQFTSWTYLGNSRSRSEHFRAIDFYTGVAFIGIFSLLNSAVLLIVALNRPPWENSGNVSEFV